MSYKISVVTMEQSIGERRLAYDECFYARTAYPQRSLLFQFLLPRCSLVTTVVSLFSLSCFFETSIKQLVGQLTNQICDPSTFFFNFLYGHLSFMVNYAPFYGIQHKNDNFTFCGQLLTKLSSPSDMVHPATDAYAGEAVEALKAG